MTLSVCQVSARDIGSGRSEKIVVAGDTVSVAPWYHPHFYFPQCRGLLDQPKYRTRS